MSKLVWMAKVVLFATVNWFFLRAMVASSGQVVAVACWVAFLGLVHLLGGWRAFKA